MQSGRDRRFYQKSKKKCFGENSGGYDTNPMTHLDAGQPQCSFWRTWSIQTYGGLSGSIALALFTSRYSPARQPAGERARDYHDAIRDGRLSIHVTDGQQRNAGQSGSS